MWLNNKRKEQWCRGIRPHASDGPGFIEIFFSCYKGQNFYIDELLVSDNNLITSGSAGALLWAKKIIEHLGVFRTDTLESWYEYYKIKDQRI